MVASLISNNYKLAIPEPEAEQAFDEAERANPSQTLHGRLVSAAADLISGPPGRVSTSTPGRVKARSTGRSLLIVEAVVVVVLCLVGLERLITPYVNTISTSFIQFQTATDWSVTQVTGSEVDLSNTGDGELIIGFGDSARAGVSSDMSALSNFRSNVAHQSSRLVRLCVAEHPATVGGKAGVQEGYRFTNEGTDYCAISWVDYVSSSRYYYWNFLDDYSQLSTVQQENSVMQGTVTWKV